MSLLYHREENEREVVIVYKYYAAYYIALLTLLIIVITNPALGTLFLPLLIALSVTQIVGLWRPNKELKQAMMKDQVSISGNKFSFTNPLTARIKKQ